MSSLHNDLMSVFPGQSRSECRLRGLCGTLPARDDRGDGAALTDGARHMHCEGGRVTRAARSRDRYASSPPSRDSGGHRMPRHGRRRRGMARAGGSVGAPSGMNVTEGAGTPETSETPARRSVRGAGARGHAVDGLRRLAVVGRGTYPRCGAVGVMLRAGSPRRARSGRRESRGSRVVRRGLGRARGCARRRGGCRPPTPARCL